MSNFQSVMGGALWAAVATLLLFAAVDPAPVSACDTQLAAAKIVVGYADI